MNITAKTQHGIKALMDIAFHDKAGPVQRKNIALRQGIPTDYMDHILLRLKQKGLVHSFRGREGGYHLALDPREITILDIVQAVEENNGYLCDSKASTAASDDTSYARSFLTEPALQFIQETIVRQLRKYTLDMFLDDADDRMLAEGIDPIQLLDNLAANEASLQATTSPAQNKIKQKQHLEKQVAEKSAQLNAVLKQNKIKPVVMNKDSLSILMQ